MINSLDEANFRRSASAAFHIPPSQRHILLLEKSNIQKDKLEKMKQDQIRKEMGSCTFRPKLVSHDFFKLIRTANPKSIVLIILILYFSINDYKVCEKLRAKRKLN
jgi:hypothetical protein